MKRRTFIESAIGIGAGLAGLSCSAPPKTGRHKRFSFIHFTDPHVYHDRGAEPGFRAAIARMNEIEHDFCIAGGDLVMDILGSDEAGATAQLDLYDSCIADLRTPVHNVIGNHDVFGLYVPDKVPEDHPDWGKGMFRRRCGGGVTYRSFDHGGVHFVLLDSINIVPRANEPGHRYIGGIGPEQMTWLAGDLAALPAGTPVIAAAHHPLFTFSSQIRFGPLYQHGESQVITDGKELYDLLIAHNTIGFLEGHTHIVEHYRYLNLTVLDSGAVCANKWGGNRFGNLEGFMLVDVYDDGIEGKYINYGWDASKYVQT